MVNKLKEINTSWWRKAMGIVPIIIAVLIVVLLVKLKSSPEKKELVETARPMRVIQVPVVDLIPRAIGFGVAEPGRIWRAISEVKGRVTEIHPDLKAGSVIQEGAVLLKIDPAEYEISIASLKATIDQTKADLAELQIQEENTGTSLAIEKRSLDLAEQSLARKQNALKNRTISANEVDQEERNVLSQRQNVQNLQSSLTLYPSQRKALQAGLTANEAGLSQAELDLSKTIIVAPFHCRLGEVNIERGQFLASGQELFEAHSTVVTEVEAQFLGDQLRPLIDTHSISTTQAPLDMATLRTSIDMKAIVRIRSGVWYAEWQARFERIRETVDPDTRAISVVVAVDKPYEKIIPGKRPPLTRGLFCEVELQGAKQPNSIVISRVALHGNTVYLVNGENRLQPIPVTVAYAQSDFVVIESGLQGGETLVVSNPSPAITGMLVDPVRDTKLEERLLLEATAGVELK